MKNNSLKTAARATALCLMFAVAITVSAQSIYTPYTFANYAGQPGGPGVANGATGQGARFRAPIGTAVDLGGNVYVADQNNFTIRKITPDGVVTTLAGNPGQPGTNDGVGALAKFGSIFGGPIGVAVDVFTNVYVADTFNHTIRKITPDGTVTTFAGTRGLSGTNDGTGSGAKFSGPQGIATDKAGNVYVSDSGNYTIRKITPAGAVTTIAGTAGQSGTADGTNGVARFGYSILGGAVGLAVDAGTNLYVADTFNDTVRQVTPQGSDWVVTTIAGTPRLLGFANGTNQAASFDNPFGIAVNGGGAIYVTDSPAQTIRKITFSGTNRIVTTPAGQVVTYGASDGIGSAGLFQTPRGAAVDTAGNLYVADFGNNTIRKLTPAGTNLSVTTIAGRAGGPGSSNGVANAAQFYLPHGVALDAATNLYVTDQQNHLIRKITPAGVVSTVAGSAGNKGYVDGVGLGTAQFSSPNGLAIDASSNLYVADMSNETIRKITPSAVVTTYAGVTGVIGNSNGPASAALFNQPNGVVADAHGNIYVADLVNRTIRKIAADGTVSLFAGSTSLQGTNDGLGTAAKFNSPGSLGIDGAGNLYVADQGNDSIRKITSDGLVTTFAGKGKASGTNDGVGDQARFNNPQGVAVDVAGNVYVCDTGSHTIRMITPGGSVSTIAGAPQQSGSADGTNGTARFDVPRGIAVDDATNLFVADSANSTIRKISPVGTNWVVTTIAGTAGDNGSTDSTNGAAQFHFPYGVAVDKSGNVFAVDRSNQSVRKISPVGTNWVVTTFAGTPGIVGGGDGTGGGAQFYQPDGIVVDSDTNIYIGDYGNSVIRKISPVGTNWAVTTLAGIVGVTGTNNSDHGPALFHEVHGVAVDGAHNVYVADTGNRLVRMVTPAGVVTTVAGKAGVGGLLDGTGSGARFSAPLYLAADHSGNLFVADGVSVRKVTVPDGVVTTIAGCPSGGCPDAENSVDAVGTDARFWLLGGIALDSAGNVYLADTPNQTIRKATFSGGEWSVTTLGGVTGQASAADGAGSVARFNQPVGMAVDAAGNVYVANQFENSIAKGSPANVTAPFEFDTSGGGLIVANGSLQLHVTGPASGSVILETSTDLHNWTPVSTNVLAVGGVTVTLPIQTDPSRFFRARLAQ